MLSSSLVKEEKQTLSSRARALFQSKNGIERFNQYSVIPVLLAHIENQGENISYFEKIKLQQGLCNGLSAYYLYSRLNKRKEQFFAHLASGLEKKPDPLKLDKLTNYVRWLQCPDRFLSGAAQNNFSENVNYIKSADEPTIFPATGITFPFKEEEFVIAMQALTARSQMITLQRKGHAMGLFVEEGKYYFFDPDFNCDAEISFTNLHDLYVWLVLASTAYQFAELEKLQSPCLSIGMNFYHTAEGKKAGSSNPQKLITEFINNEPNALLRDINKINPLFIACAANQPEVVAVMLEHSAKELLELGEPNSDLTPLMVSCENGYSECTELLVKAGADINANLYNISHAFDKAIRSQNLKTINLLIENKADIYLKTEFSTPLFTAVEHGNLEVFQCLFKKHKDLGGNANFVDKKKSLLYCAIQNEKHDIALWLIENSADTNLVSEDFYCSETPLQIAIKKGNLSVVKSLLAAGAKLGPCQESPISLSAKSKNVEVVKFFIAKKEQEEKYFRSELQTDIDKAFANALAVNDFCIAEYLAKNYKTTSRGDNWVNGHKLAYYPKMFSLLKHELLAGSITHLSSYDPIGDESLATWAFKNSREQKSEASLSVKDECAQLIMAQLKKDPQQLFLLQANLRINELRRSFSLEANATSEKMQQAYRFTRFYYENNYKKALEKRNALNNLAILLTNGDCSIKEALNEVMQEYPSILEGGFTHPIQDLIKWLTTEGGKYKSPFLQGRKV